MDPDVSSVVFEVRFLVPVIEDPGLGNGEKHPHSRWETLNTDLFAMFGGYTRNRAPVDGVYADPDTGEAVHDESIVYIVALRAGDVPRIRAYVKNTVTRLFVQKRIYFHNGSHVEFLDNPDR